MQTEMAISSILGYLLEVYPGDIVGKTLESRNSSHDGEWCFLVLSDDVSRGGERPQASKCFLCTENSVWKVPVISKTLRVTNRTYALTGHQEGMKR